MGFLNYSGSDNPPTQFSSVCESDAYIENAFLECVVGPIHDLAMDTGVLLAVDNFPEGTASQVIFASSLVGILLLRWRGVGLRTAGWWL